MFNIFFHIINKKLHHFPILLHINFLTLIRYNH
jgi:hypothetical protein